MEGRRRGGGEGDPALISASPLSLPLPSSLPTLPLPLSSLSPPTLLLPPPILPLPSLPPTPNPINRWQIGFGIRIIKSGLDLLFLLRVVLSGLLGFRFLPSFIPFFVMSSVFLFFNFFMYSFWSIFAFFCLFLCSFFFSFISFTVFFYFLLFFCSFSLCFYVSLPHLFLCFFMPLLPSPLS